MYGFRRIVRVMKRRILVNSMRRNTGYLGLYAQLVTVAVSLGLAHPVRADPRAAGPVALRRHEVDIDSAGLRMPAPDSVCPRAAPLVPGLDGLVKHIL